MSGKQKPEKSELAENVSEVMPDVKADKFSVNALARSVALSEFGLHQDIIRAILGDNEYTVDDAKKAIQNYIDSFNN